MLSWPTRRITGHRYESQIKLCFPFLRIPLQALSLSLCISSFLHHEWLRSFVFFKLSLSLHIFKLSSPAHLLLLLLLHEWFLNNLWWFLSLFPASQFDAQHFLTLWLIEFFDVCLEQNESLKLLYAQMPTCLLFLYQFFRLQFQTMTPLDAWTTGIWLGIGKKGNSSTSFKELKHYPVTQIYVCMDQRNSNTRISLTWIQL